jgi:hypothetical protein
VSSDGKDAAEVCVSLFSMLPLVLSAATAAPPPAVLDEALAGRLAQLALSCVHREYPNKISHVMMTDADARPARKLTPAFYGCYDWHSAVHGHWLLVRLVRQYPNAPWAKTARAKLAKSFTAKNIAAELAYVRGKNRASFERPYGLAWLLQLGAELHTWDDAQAKQWSKTLEPLERESAAKLAKWLPLLTHPLRTGEHSQTAFALGLTLDWARARGDAEVDAVASKRARDFFARDTGCPLSYEPGGEDFLSPCIAEADVMRRVVPPAEFAMWLTRFLPHGLTVNGAPLAPVVPSDRSDPKLVHLDGLNLSRAWMLHGIASGLPDNDPRRASFEAAAAAHAKAGLEGVSDVHYEGGHWLGSFAVYLLTARGLPTPVAASSGP